MTYGMEAVLPMEFIIGSARTLHIDKKQNMEDLDQNLDMLDEKREVVSLR